MVVKSWLRVRRSFSSNDASPQDSPKPTAIGSEASQRHAWVQSGDNTSTTSDSEQNTESNTTTTHGANKYSHLHNDLATPIGKLSIRQLMDSTAAQLVRVPATHQQHILVRSEHYFRLALESWEQLRACHFKASQKFSLAEWMHIHALLLYGRIQKVREPFSAESLAQHNMIDLSTDVSVFRPLATALNSIGIVEDKEGGVTYIPDAVFPKKSSTSFVAYTADEMQHILAGTMYDWQRSWRRVLEARHSRDTQYSKFDLVRSSSELISAIQAKSELISRIHLNQHSMKTEIVLEDYKSELEELEELLEEARNAKDYTIRPPCVRVYEGADISSSAGDPPQLAHSLAQTAASSDSTITGLTEPVDSDDIELRLPASMTLPMLSLDPKEETPSIDLPLKSVLHKPPTPVELDFGVTVEPADSLKSMGPLEGLATDATLPEQSSTSKHNKGNSSAQPGSSHVITPPSSSIFGTTSRSSRMKRQRVQLAGAADASDCFVHFDARVWADYQAFVDALRSTGLTQFSGLNKELEGTWAWLLPVKLGTAAETPRLSQDNLPSSPLSPGAAHQTRTLQSTAPLTASTFSKHQRLSIRLPRASIPKTEQSLALLLQTSSLCRNIQDSWNVASEVELDMRRLVLDYVNSGIFDKRATSD